MTDFRFRRLERFKTGGSRDKMQLSIPLPTTETGKVLRYCPNDQCVPRRFQLGGLPDQRSISSEHAHLIRRQPGVNSITCPYCGNDSSDDTYNAPEDIKAAQNTIGWAVEQDVGDWLEDFAHDFNRNAGKGGLISISMETKRSNRPAPCPWRQDLLRDLTCNICHRRYGVYAIGFFCPDCGARNLSVHFQREVELIAGQIDLAEGLPTPEKRELSYRILGNAYEDVVTAFEAYLKSIFRFAAPKRLNFQQMEAASKEARGNPFQNIERSRKLFAYLGLDPFSCLDSEELKALELNIEKRHVIGHNLGLADEKYVDVAQEGSLGETVTLLADEVERFAILCDRIVGHLESGLPEFLPPSAPQRIS
jgi:predicted RNA-binding Zn-ribbon protein involved in translation (DUF1610 family)